MVTLRKQRIRFKRYEWARSDQQLIADYQKDVRVPIPSHPVRGAQSPLSVESLGFHQNENLPSSSETTTEFVKVDPRVQRRFTRSFKRGQVDSVSQETRW